MNFKQNYIILLFIIILSLFSLLTYKKIPIANGEEFRYLRGAETLDHLLYGKFTEKLVQPIPNYFLYNSYVAALVLLNPGFYYEKFHLLNMFFSIFGFVAVYLLAFELTKKKIMALLSLLFLLLFPGFFGQLAFNPIDMPFAVLYMWSLYSILKYSKNDSNHWSTIIIGLLFGITQGLRQLGFTLYFVLVASDIYDWYFSNNLSLAVLGANFKEVFKKLRANLKPKLIRYFYIFIIANLFMIITWPNFAINVFKNYVWYLFIGSNFYLWDFGLLFFGKFLENIQRPIYYLPFLQLITYPIYIILLFLPVFIFLKSKIRNRTYFILVFALFLNYVLYVLLNPVLYDGIRHFLFMIPIIVLIAVSNLDYMLTKLRGTFLKYLVVGFVILNLFYLGIYTIKEFPYQYVYFNRIAYLFGNPYKLFESDYSSTKYREASEWIRDVYLKDESNYSHSNLKYMLKVYPCDNAYAVDYFSHKKFLTVINKKEADLVLCDYRNLLQSGYKGEILKTFYISGHDVLYVMVLK